MNRHRRSHDEGRADEGNDEDDNDEDALRDTLASADASADDEPPSQSSTPQLVIGSSGASGTGSSQSSTASNSPEHGLNDAEQQIGQWEGLLRGRGDSLCFGPLAFQARSFFPELVGKLFITVVR